MHSVCTQFDDAFTNGIYFYLFLLLWWLNFIIANFINGNLRVGYFMSSKQVDYDVRKIDDLGFRCVEVLVCWSSGSDEVFS